MIVRGLLKITSPSSQLKGARLAMPTSMHSIAHEKLGQNGVVRTKRFINDGNTNLSNFMSGHCIALLEGVTIGGKSKSKLLHQIG